MDMCIVSYCKIEQYGRNTQEECDDASRQHDAVAAYSSPRVKGVERYERSAPPQEAVLIKGATRSMTTPHLPGALSFQLQRRMSKAVEHV